MVFVRLDAVRSISCCKNHFLAFNLQSQMALGTFDIFFLDVKVHGRLVAEEIGPLYQVKGDLNGKGAIGMVDEASGHGIFQTGAIVLVES